MCTTRITCKSAQSHLGINIDNEAVSHKFSTKKQGSMSFIQKSRVQYSQINHKTILCADSQRRSFSTGAGVEWVRLHPDTSSKRCLHLFFTLVTSCHLPIKISFDIKSKADYTDLENYPSATQWLRLHPRAAHQSFIIFCKQFANIP